jgi:hypothetical protein
MGIAQERRVPGGPSLITHAQGAEVDSAALTPQAVPFLASANAGAESIQPAEDVDMLYGEGVLKDAEPVVKVKTIASADNAGKIPASGIIYQVAAGDTVESISVTFGIPMNTIIEFNPSVNFSALSPGMSIMIPGQKDLALLSG